MEKEFVPYELAVKLKALGFDKPCIRYYVEDGYLSNLTIQHACDAPLFQQAFSWFREKYNLQSEIEFRHCEYSFKINFQKLANGENPPIMVWHLVDSWLGLNIDLFHTYEEAELACLTKLIEIVESKSK